ncbi:hypothetical protein C8Q72DRAFT_799139 [Fomitopsis betulina]|nr:hypothetical protein C8Q72DRAFT_799139 [Fomitopsis betulina]
MMPLPVGGSLYLSSVRLSDQAAIRMTFWRSVAHSFGIHLTALHPWSSRFHANGRKLNALSTARSLPSTYWGPPIKPSGIPETYHLWPMDSSMNGESATLTTTHILLTPKASIQWTRDAIAHRTRASLEYIPVIALLSQWFSKRRSLATGFASAYLEVLPCHITYIVVLVRQRVVTKTGTPYKAWDWSALKVPGYPMFLLGPLLHPELLSCSRYHYLRGFWDHFCHHSLLGPVGPSVCDDRRMEKMGTAVALQFLAVVIPPVFTVPIGSRIIDDIVSLYGADPNSH